MKRLIVSLTDQEVSAIVEGKVTLEWVAWLMRHIMEHSDEVIWERHETDGLSRR